LSISGLPTDAVVDSSLLGGLRAGEQRVIIVDMSNVMDFGDYVITITA
jgi:hypothetical protein